MNFLDIIIIGALLLGGLTGYHKGLINSIIDTVGVLVSLVIAFTTYKILTPFLVNQLGMGKIVEGILKKTMSQQIDKVQFSGNNDFFGTISALTHNLPLGLQKQLNQILTNQLQSLLKTTLLDTGPNSSLHYMSVLIVSIIAFLIILFGCMLVLRLIGRVITRLIRKSFVGTINNSGGFVAGVLVAVLSISVAAGFLVPIISVSSPTFSRLVSESLLTSYLLQIFVVLSNLVG